MKNTNKEIPLSLTSFSKFKNSYLKRAQNSLLFALKDAELSKEVENFALASYKEGIKEAAKIYSKN